MLYVLLAFALTTEIGLIRARPQAPLPLDTAIVSIPPFLIKNATTLFSGTGVISPASSSIRTTSSKHSFGTGPLSVGTSLPSISPESRSSTRPDILPTPNPTSTPPSTEGIVATTGTRSENSTANPTVSTNLVPLPAGATVVTATINSQIISETFVPATLLQYATISAELSTLTQDFRGSSIPLFIGRGGLIWTPFGQPSAGFDIPPPTKPPSNADAMKPTITDSSRTATPVATIDSLATETPSDLPVQSSDVVQTSSKTQGASSQTPPPLLTITAYKPDVVTVSVDRTISSNTAVSTSDDSHILGLYPFIHGGASCFFCPPNLVLGGLVLFGMNRPGIYPPLPDPPFPGITNWPTIVVDNNLIPSPVPEEETPPKQSNPDESAKSLSTKSTTLTTSSTSSSCGRSTIASNCIVRCPTRTSSSAVSCSTTCSAPMTGCSVHGTTTTDYLTGAVCMSPQQTVIGIEQAERLLAELSSQSFGTGTASAPGIGPITVISDANITTRMDPTTRGASETRLLSSIIGGMPIMSTIPLGTPFPTVGSSTIPPPPPISLAPPAPDPTPTPAATSASDPPPRQPAIPPAAPECVQNPQNAVRDAHEEILTESVNWFCSEYATNHVAADQSVRIQQTVSSYSGMLGLLIEDYTGDHKEDDVYEISVSSVEQCKPDDGYNLPEPVSGFKCEDILYRAWKDCNNQGRGGEILAGCLLYSINTKF